MLAAEQHEPVTEVRGLSRVDQFAQRVFHFYRVFFIFDEAQPVGQTDAVRVGNNGRLAEDVAQDEVGRFAADTGEFEQILHVIRHFAVILLEQHDRTSLEVARFGAEQAAGFDCVCDFLLGRGGKTLKRGELLEQRFGYDVDTCVRTLRGQARGE